MDSKAVSALVGFVLMLAIIMGFIGIMQSKFVPEWNKDVEAKHLDKLSYELADLSEAVSLAASTGNAMKVVIDAGVSYPEYYVLVSPSKAATTVYTKELSVIVNGETYETHAIIIQPQYLYSSHPKFVFEHSAVFRLERSNLVVDSDQSSFTQRKITIYLINTTFSSLTTTENLNLVLYPVSYGGSTHYDSLTIAIESYSNKTAEWWENTLSSLGFTVSRNGRNITVTAANVDLSIEYFVAYATTAGSVSLNPPIGPLRILNLSEQSYSVYKGTTVPLGVKVVDRFNNPARNVAVDIFDSCHGSTTKITDDKGELWYYFSASDSGACEVRFSIPSDSFTYQITVSSVSGGGGIFKVFWNVTSPFNWNVSLLGPQKNFKVSVYYDNNPVDGATVDISTDAPNLVGYPESVVTDQYGEGVVTVTALDNGTAHLFATAGGSGDVLELILTGAGGGFCPAGWSYYREITIQNNVDDELTDYQIKIELDTQSLISAGKMRNDCGDIRFYDENWTSTLSYWIEDGTCDTTNTIIWVKVPNIPASGAAKIYMIYGNPLASSESDGYDTFVFFDDFNTWSGWINYGSGAVYSDTYSGISVLRKDDNCDPNGGYKFLNLGTTIDNFRLMVKDRRDQEGWDCSYDRYGVENGGFNGFGIIRLAYTSAYGYFGWEVRQGASSVYRYYTSTQVYQPYGNWYITELTRYYDKISANIYDNDGKLIATTGLNTVPSSYQGYSNFDKIVVRGGRPYYLDWIAIGKYVYPEPTIKTGTEQTC